MTKRLVVIFAAFLIVPVAAKANPTQRSAQLCTYCTVDSTTWRTHCIDADVMWSRALSVQPQWRY